MAEIDGAEIEQISTDNLYFDADNPRLQGKVKANEQDVILETLWRKFSVDEIVMSIAANGYFSHEPLLVVSEDDHLIAIEGNRRLAAVKLLTDADARKVAGATDIPKLSDASKKKLITLPVIFCKRAETWQYVGFKHVNGPQQWQSHSKAQYIAWVKDELGVSLEDIASKIGDRHQTVERLYRAEMVLNQAEKEGVYSIDDRWKTHFSFSHLYTGLSYRGFQEFLKLSQDKLKPNPVSKTKLKELGELCEWLYGSKQKEIQPLIERQNPDLRRLEEVLQGKNGVAALRRGMPLSVALDISRGDERLFRESMVSAKQELQEARGKMITGYEGETDLLETAKDVNKLAENIYKEMKNIKDEKSEKKRSKRKG